MRDFFSQLKEVLIREENDDQKFDACGYFETIMQHKDKFKVIIDEGEKYDFYIALVRRDKNDDYGLDNVKVYLQNNGNDFTLGGANHHYQITLEYDERHWGYCECQPNDSDYNKEYECCGVGCDWNAPMVSVCRIDSLGNFAFIGYEKDLWKLQSEWQKQFEGVEDKQRQERLNFIQQEIQRLQIEQEELQKALK